ncbi:MULTISPECIES: hypothetical protein [unclassified Lentimonas]|uniref:hypothetical protein n=1 Tax=unclassified Lentimonas TaxID=2630993 RepID=UPI0013254DC1|nr:MULTISPECIES: hypothetical protein [unclassified Lentimonas]CAA6690693.1 Unannotated [Lentimonas sp. CC19]CAA6693369.1 Unannotated [Lentimonas sp. CC10]CAA7071843.1 Unannotated [Lentimonas sp. CC11]
MKNTQCILTLACTLAFAGCSETTKNSQTPASKAPAGSLGTTTELVTAPSVAIPQIQVHETAIEAVVVEPEPIVVEAPDPVVAVAEIIEPEPVVVEVVEPEPVVVVETPVSAPAPEYVFPDKTPRNLQQRFIDNDVDQDGYLSLEEFTGYLSVWLAKNQPHRDAETWAPGPFNKKDTNGDGKLSPAEAFGQ